MKTEFTRQEAHDFLADLLIDENDIKQQTLFDNPRDYTPKPQPKWIVQGITLVFVQHTCKRCDRKHIHTSPKLLLDETLLDVDGTVLKMHQTLSPKKFNATDETVCNLGEPTPVSDLKIEQQFIEGEPLDFCKDCIEIGTWTGTELRSLFIAQQNTRAKKSTGERLERIAAAQKALDGKKQTAEQEAHMLDDLLTAQAVEEDDEV